MLSGRSIGDEAIDVVLEAGVVGDETERLSRARSRHRRPKSSGNFALPGFSSTSGRLTRPSSVWSSAVCGTGVETSLPLTRWPGVVLAMQKDAIARKQYVAGLVNENSGCSVSC